MKTVSTNLAPSAIGPYSQAKISGNLVFVSGQIPVCPTSGLVVEGGIVEQTHQVCKNLSAVLSASGSSLDQTVKTTCYLAEIADFAKFNAVYAEYFTNCPARACVAVKDLPKGVLVEIDAIGEID